MIGEIKLFLSDYWWVRRLHIAVKYFFVSGTLLWNISSWATQYFVSGTGWDTDLNLALNTVYMRGLMVEERYPNQRAILPTPGASLVWSWIIKMVWSKLVFGFVFVFCHRWSLVRSLDIWSNLFQPCKGLTAGGATNSWNKMLMSVIEKNKIHLIWGSWWRKAPNRWQRLRKPPPALGLPSLQTGFVKTESKNDHLNIIRMMC